MMMLMMEDSFNFFHSFYQGSFGPLSCAIVSILEEAKNMCTCGCSPNDMRGGNREKGEKGEIEEERRGVGGQRHAQESSLVIFAACRDMQIRPREMRRST
jgi:hypothetical protein